MHEGEFGGRTVLKATISVWPSVQIWPCLLLIRVLATYSRLSFTRVRQLPGLSTTEGTFSAVADMASSPLALRVLVNPCGCRQRSLMAIVLLVPSVIPEMRVVTRKVKMPR